MLMSAAVYMDSSSTTTPPWLIADHHHGAYSSSPLSAAQVQSNHHHLLPPSSSRSHRAITKKRRPRPSQRLPTTYINADAASFRRMVQHVTGASSSDHDIPVPALPPAQEEPTTKVTASGLFLSRPAPIKLSSRTEMLLPTLDTSAFLATGDGASSAGGGASCCNTAAAASTGFPTLESWDPLF